MNEHGKPPKAFMEACRKWQINEGASWFVGDAGVFWRAACDHYTKKHAEIARGVNKRHNDQCHCLEIAAAIEASGEEE